METNRNMKAMAVRTRTFEVESEGISIGPLRQAAVILPSSFALRNSDLDNPQRQYNDAYDLKQAMRLFCSIWKKCCVGFTACLNTNVEFTEPKLIPDT
jgi:hypothetical protein